LNCEAETDYEASGGIKDHGFVGFSKGLDISIA